MQNVPPSRLPARSLLEDGLPVEQLYQLAKREGNAKKPNYEIHKCSSVQQLLLIRRRRHRRS